MASITPGEVVTSLRNLQLGCSVHLVSDQGGDNYDDFYSCTGVVHSVDVSDASDPVLWLKDCTEEKTGRLEPAVLDFKRSEIRTLVFLKGKEKCRDEVEAPGAVEKSKKAPSRRLMTKYAAPPTQPHLNRLQSLDMESLLKQKQVAPAPALARLELQKGQPLVLPYPGQDYALMVGDGYRYRSSAEVAAVRSHLWEHQEKVPSLMAFPDKFYLVEDHMGEAMEVAKDTIEKEEFLGVSLEGQMLGRRGQLSLLCLSTTTSVFVFDVVKLEEDDPQGLFVRVPILKEVLETPDVMKVLHDARFAADILWHKYNVALRNVYDTLAAHVVFLSWALYAGHMPAYVVPVSYMAEAYLGIKREDLFFPHYRLQCLSKDTSVWMERPLPAELQVGAMRNVAFLLDLQTATRKCMNSPFLKATTSLLNVVRECDDLDAENHLFRAERLPEKVLEVLPNMMPDPKRISRYGPVEEDRRVIHNYIGQTDPTLVFSRDCMHQVKKT